MGRKLTLEGFASLPVVWGYQWCDNFTGQPTLLGVRQSSAPPAFAAFRSYFFLGFSASITAVWRPVVAPLTLAWVTSTVVPGPMTERIAVTKPAGRCIRSTPSVLMISPGWLARSVTPT